jgi:hypothetical protein
MIEFTHASSQYLLSDSSWTIPDGGTLSFWFTLTLDDSLRFPIRHTPNFYLRINSTNLEMCLYRQSNQRTFVGTAFTIGQQYHVACQWLQDSKEYNEAFFDGVSVASGSKNRGVPASNQTYVGWDVSSSYLNGIIADMRIYNRLLTLKEIQTIHACRGTDGISSGLLHRWMMNEGAENAAVSGSGVVKDWVADGINMTPTNSPVYRSSDQKWRRAA